jgi:hypothetical protein
LNDTFAGNYTNFTTVYGYALNSTDTDTFVANYSDYLITKAYSSNDTDFNSSGLIKDWNATGHIKDWLIDIATANTSIKDWIDAQAFLTAFTELDPKWTANYSDFLIAYNYAINSTGDTSWINNYSAFLTHIDWSKVINGTVLKQADFNTNYTANDVIYRDKTNTSYALESMLNNGSYQNIAETDALAYNGTLMFASNWNATNTSYYLESNPYGYYNSTNPSPDTDTFVANYSDYLITKTYASNDTNYNASGLIKDWNSTGYIKDWQVPITSANTSLKNWIDAQAFLTVFTELDPKWTANYSNFLIGYNYAINSTGDTSWVNNYSTFLTHIDWAKVINGTMLSQATYNTNYTANDAAYRLDTDTDTFVANYSTYLTKPTWANVMNGTVTSGLINWANAINGTLMSQSTFNTNYTANDAAYRLDTNTDTFVANYSDYLITKTYASNDTNWNSSGLIKDFNATGYIANWNATGFIQNWSAIISSGGITWANAVNGTLMSQATFNTNYTTSLAKLGTNTFTGNQNMSTNNITLTNATSGGAYLCLNQACTSYIRNNGSGVVIQG